MIFLLLLVPILFITLAALTYTVATLLLTLGVAHWISVAVGGVLGALVALVFALDRPRHHR